MPSTITLLLEKILHRVEIGECDTYILMFSYSRPAYTKIYLYLNGKGAREVLKKP